MRSLTAPGNKMRFADVWESDIFPQELLDMILSETLPRRLKVRLRVIDYGESDRAQWVIEGIDPSDWNIVKELVAYLRDVRKTALRTLSDETDLVLVDTDPQSAINTQAQDMDSHSWPAGRMIKSQSASNIVKFSASLLTHFNSVEVTTPYIIGFGLTPSDGFRNNLMLRCTVRCQLPQSDRDEFDYEIERQINASSCAIYEPSALDWVMDYVEDATAYHVSYLEAMFANPSDVEGVLMSGDLLANQMPDTESPGVGGFGGGLIHEVDEGSSAYGYRIATTRHAQFDYENAGQEGSAWSSEWRAIEWDDVKEMIEETKRKAAMAKLEEDDGADGEADQEEGSDGQD